MIRRRAAESAADRTDRRQPVLPGGERPRAGRDRRAGRRARRPPPGRASREHPGAGYRSGGAGGAHRPPAIGGQAAAPDGGGDRKGSPVRAARADRRHSGAELQAGLSRLQAAELLYAVSLFPELELTFKHALTHEVAYGGLLQVRRRALHARIVGAIEALYPDRLDEHVERLAQHAFRGQVWEKASEYCRQAGARAMGVAPICQRRSGTGIRRWPRSTACPGRRRPLSRRSTCASTSERPPILAESYERALEYVNQAEELAALQW